MFARSLTLVLLLAGCVPSSAQDEPRARNQQTAWAAQCRDDSGWDDPGPPFKIHGNAYYVGTCGIGAILITGEQCHVLIDTGTEKGGELVAANIRALGFDPTDVEVLLLSHEHHDHAGGTA
jgi:metallo-beta-lactamase class B